MFDVFYLDHPTELFPNERQAHSLDHARELSRTRYLWVVDARNDYSGFDWLWEPAPWQAAQAHVWPSQHQVNGGTWLLPRAGYQDINRDHTIVRRTGSQPKVMVHHNDTPPQADHDARYISDYLGTMRRALRRVSWPWCWVISDLCDYTDFDWSWHPSEWQLDLVHVFASNEQRFGDTFYLHVPTFLARSENIQVLEHHPGLNFVDQMQVRRPPPAQVRYHTDSVVPAIKQHRFQDPIVQFYRHQPAHTVPTISLWSAESKTVTSLDPANSTVLVPREAAAITAQVYDYPYISHQPRQASPPLDIVFISNGEPNADQHWGALLHRKQGQPNRCMRVDGVNGRAAAYHAAAEASETAWFFAVFAKLDVLSDFDWTWQPDYLQQPKHYIFHALNPVNMLEYGHQAMIAYNRDLVLANPGRGLDFTLDDAHEVVPILSGVARYNINAWTAWRTAFREVIKLRASLPDVENEHRMNKWLTVGNGPYGEWSVYGAEDGVAYYEEVGGDFDQLRKSYEWSWLASYAFVKRRLAIDQ